MLAANRIKPYLKPIKPLSKLYWVVIYMEMDNYPKSNHNTKNQM